MRIMVLPGVTNNLSPFIKSLYCHMGDAVDLFDFSLNSSEKMDIIHVHWPEYVVWSEKRGINKVKYARWVYQRLRSMKSQGAKVIWTVHNISPHELRVFEDIFIWPIFFKEFVKLVDGFVFLSEMSAEAFFTTHRKLSSLPYAVIPHGEDEQLLSFNISKSEARKKIGVPDDAEVISHVGAIRPYKNLKALVDVFCKYDNNKARLIIAGSPLKDNLRRELEASAASDSRVYFDFDFLKSEKVARYQAASDLVVFPYKKITNSGAAYSALSASRPIMIPDLNTLAFLPGSVGEEWVKVFQHPLTPSVLDKGLIWAALDKKQEKPNVIGWPRLSMMNLDFYRRVIAN